MIWVSILDFTRHSKTLKTRKTDSRVASREALVFVMSLEPDSGFKLPRLKRSTLHLQSSKGESSDTYLGLIRYLCMIHQVELRTTYHSGSYLVGLQTEFQVRVSLASLELDPLSTPLYEL